MKQTEAVDLIAQLLALAGNYFRNAQTI